jgi:hypothetical protein
MRPLLNGGTLGGRMTRSRNELIELVRTGALEALAALSADVSDPLRSFALCTDDGVTTLFHVGCTEGFLRAGGRPELRFLPNDWTQTGGSDPSALRAVGDHFRQRPQNLEDDAWCAVRDADFEILVAGLAAARSTYDRHGSIFFTVMSTDPSDHLLELEEHSLRVLNPPHLVKEWRQWRLRDAQDYLLELLARPEPRTYAEQDSIERLRAEALRFQSLLEA